eukprot:TRINITY_DN8508_c0_g1_i4.p1 TRINITY_DN8508_c0_g1~~TRINITY_DN8508_c0_g1_i4.p1  ORF type:complete len:190 (-),score=38.22 TRINITY_DN8508_c0_g1_i4:304-804(-)
MAAQTSQRRQLVGLTTLVCIAAACASWMLISQVSSAFVQPAQNGRRAALGSMLGGAVLGGATAANADTTGTQLWEFPVPSPRLWVVKNKAKEKMQGKDWPACNRVCTQLCQDWYGPRPDFCTEICEDCTYEGALPSMELPYNQCRDKLLTQIKLTNGKKLSSYVDI